MTSFNDEYIIKQNLGSGTTGKVKLVEKIINNKEYAVKIIKKNLFETKPELQKKIKREIALMKLLDHPNIIKLEDYAESNKHMYIFLEYAKNGELFEYLIKNQPLKPERAMEIFREIIYGLEYLHSRSICHRDLKPENLLLNEFNRVKIADFGFAKWTSNSIADTSCGSPHYAAPEIIKGIKYDGRLVDVWSCGVILYALHTVCMNFFFFKKY